MKPIIMVMLAVQAAMLLATAFAILTRRDRRRRGTVALPLAIAAGVSFQIADRHDGAAGAEMLLVGGAFLLGMAVCYALFALRERRAGADA